VRSAPASCRARRWPRASARARARTTSSRRARRSSRKARRLGGVTPPAALTSLAAELIELPGVVAVALGGSRATGTHRPDSDWDLGLYYRGAFDAAAVGGLGHPGYVSELGEWGPIVNGGAWLTVGDLPVDVLFRDLAVGEGGGRAAERGRFDVLPQNGYVVGAPTYLPVGELAVHRPLAGELPRPEFPAALAAAAPGRWRGRASVALMFAASHAKLADAVCCTGMLAGAVLCAAHARLAEQRAWVLNEKRLVERAGLDRAADVLAQPGDLAAAVEVVAEILEIEPLAAR
jgi:predicted nucleotidyltransferase